MHHAAMLITFINYGCINQSHMDEKFILTAVDSSQLEAEGMINRNATITIERLCIIPNSSKLTRLIDVGEIILGDISV